MRAGGGLVVPKWVWLVGPRLLALALADAAGYCEPVWSGLDSTDVTSDC